MLLFVNKVKYSEMHLSYNKKRHLDTHLLIILINNWLKKSTESAEVRLKNADSAFTPPQISDSYLSKLVCAIRAMKVASPTTWAILPRASPAAQRRMWLGLSNAPITRARADLRTSSGPRVLLFSAKPWNQWRRSTLLLTVWIIGSALFRRGCIAFFTLRALSTAVKMFSWTACCRTPFACFMHSAKWSSICSLNRT